jgi:hypothetical protein
MFLRDLEPYRYGVPMELRDVVSIGWLSRVSEYPRGDVPADFIRRLEQLLSSHRVNQMRGYHVCEFCSKSPLTHVLRSGRQVILGSAEIWVPSTKGSIVYAAPDLIYHYVSEHHYRPPDGFIEAVVIASSSNQPWDADSECAKRLQAAFSN